MSRAALGARRRDPVAAPRLWHSDIGTACILCRDAVPGVSQTGTAVVDGARLRAAAVARDESADPPLVRVRLVEDIGFADVRVQGRKTKAPESRELVLPLSAFELDAPG